MSAQLQLATAPCSLTGEARPAIPSEAGQPIPRIATGASAKSSLSLPRCASALVPSLVCISRDSLPAAARRSGRVRRRHECPLQETPNRTGHPAHCAAAATSVLYRRQLTAPGLCGTRTGLAAPRRTAPTLAYDAPALAHDPAATAVDPATITVDAPTTSSEAPIIATEPPSIPAPASRSSTPSPSDALPRLGACRARPRS